MGGPVQFPHLDNVRFHLNLGDCELNCIGFVAIETMHDQIPTADWPKFR